MSLSNIRPDGGRSAQAALQDLQHIAQVRLQRAEQSLEAANQQRRTAESQVGQAGQQLLRAQRDCQLLRSAADSRLLRRRVSLADIAEANFRLERAHGDIAAAREHQLQCESELAQAIVEQREQQAAVHVANAKHEKLLAASRLLQTETNRHEARREDGELDELAVSRHGRAGPAEALAAPDMAGAGGSRSDRTSQ